MNFEFIDNVPALATALPLALVFFVGARVTPQGAISLPCVMALTTLMYFYVLPLLVLSLRDNGFFGLFLTDMRWAHFAACLYAVGAALAMLAAFDAFALDPAAPRPQDAPMSNRAFLSLWAIAGAGVVALVMTKQLTFFEADSDLLESPSQYLFLNESLNLLVPLTILWVVRRDFSLTSLLVVPLVLLLFVQVGFRFRILILLSGLGTSFATTRKMKVGVAHALAGLTVAVIMAIMVGALRSYGRGLDLARLGGSLEDTVSEQLLGECGTIYVLSSFADSPLPDPIYFEPWLLGFVRMIPTFLWPEKPTSDYLSIYSSMLALPGGDKAGVGAPQHVEMLLQFGWLGLPFLAFGYYGVVAWLLRALSRQGREARVAGYAIAPVFFGYYMQTRGYFFQIFTDGLFMFGPLLLVRASSTSAATAGPVRTSTRPLPRS